MNKFSITVVSLVTMAGFAVAQPKADPKTGSAGGAAPTGAGATVKAGAGSGSAAAGAKAGAGAGSAAAPKAGAGATAGSAAGSAAPAAPAMVMPKAPPEIAATLKMMGTRQNCTGVTWGGPEGKTEMKVKSTGTNALALDGWWIKSTSTMTMGEGKAKATMKFDSYMTWDAKAAKWRSAGMSNDGSLMVGTADFKDGKLESVSDMYGGMMGAGKWREHGDMTDPKAGFKMSGEMSTDGKTWTKVYEMTCKK
jgi:hypothetical protein